MEEKLQRIYDFVGPGLYVIAITSMIAPEFGLSR